ncbi:MAG: UDP-N-acetylmuramoyl-L-alanyl-D-glutamate--2,6-diaminopimelate ligase [Stellaceae bacterium]
MKLTELIGRPTGAGAPGDVEITGLSADSRLVRPGFLFAALAGTRQHGRDFAAAAVVRGAVAILTDDAAALVLPPDRAAGIAVISDANPQRRLAQLAARFYGRQPRTVAAVTGTNGKTSIVHFTREIWAACGHPAASLGTLGQVTPTGRRPGALTTPDPVALQRDLAALAGRGIEHVAIEASSHGLAQFRLDGLSVAAAAFTNLTRDHLDYHRDMAHYRAAKDRLFTDLLAPGGPAVLNRDSGEFARLAALCRDRDHPVIAYGAAPGAELRLLSARARPDGQDLLIEVMGRRHDLTFPLLGGFQATNALCALGLAIATGVPAEIAPAALVRLSRVPGRLEFVAEGQGGAPIVVDYAHTPDALATVLATLRPHAPGRLVIVFGCGGDRDPGKRPLMGRAAAAAADLVYVTDDNPRGEDPAAIRRAILATVPGAIEIGDRRQAIETAIAGLGRGDLLLIAGKGHETGQIIGAETRAFDDAEVARACAAPRPQAAPR